MLIALAVPESTATLVGDLARLTWEGIALGVAYGLLSMAILQMVKDLYLRRAFNRGEFNHWFQVGAANLQEAIKQGIPVAPPDGPPESAEDARGDLLNLAAAGDEDALFGLPIDKLAGQINVAANSVIETPQRHRSLLTILSKGAAPVDVKLLLSTDPAILRPKPPEAFVPQTSQEATDEANRRFDYADARTRISHHIQRTIDVLQLSATQRWTRLNQWISVVSCFLLGLIIGLAPIVFKQWFSSRYGIFTVGTFLPVSVLLALIGGCLAPLLRDLTARLGQTE